MSNERLRFVIDASVGIKLFIDEPGSDAVHALFAKLSGDPPIELYIPDLFYNECANLLLKYMIRYGRSLEDSRADLADLSLLALKSVPTASLLENALVFASAKNLTAYEACYAVLALKLEIPLITADQEVVKVVDGAIGLEEISSFILFSNSARGNK